MHLEFLRRFVTVAETLNFHEAAKRLGISQPSLSRSINQLEKEKGIRLLERGTRRVSLTVAGRVLLDESPRLLKHADLVWHVTKHSSESNRLNVGFLSMALYGVLPAALKEFRARAPGADLRLEELSSAEQHMRLHNGTLDVGFVALDPVDRHDLAMRVIENSPVMLVIPSDWKLARKKSVALAELAGLPLIAAARSASPSMHDLLELKCRAAGFTPNFVHEANQIHPILRLVASGAGIGFAPAIAAVHNVPGVRLIPVKDESFNVKLQLGMLWMDRKLPSVLNNFVKCVTDVVNAARKKKASSI